MFRRILYPTDFSDVSLQALRECVVELARLGTEELHLLHVIDITVVDFEAFELEEVYKQRIEELGEELGGDGLTVKTEVRVGIPFTEIAEYAQEKKVDLITIPSVGENIWRRMFMGSTASNLARAAKKPVLILKYVGGEGNYRPTFGDCREIFRRPLVAIDFSKCSLRVVQAVKGSEELIDELLLLHSVDYERVKDIENNIQIAKRNLEKTLKAFKVKGEAEVFVGTASSAILGTAIARKASLIVIGKKGRSFLKDLILGSTAERVMRDARVPVLLVPCG